jgi:hypothetical protein
MLEAFFNGNLVSNTFIPTRFDNPAITHPVDRSLSSHHGEERGSTMHVTWNKEQIDPLLPVGKGYNVSYPH